MANVVVSSFGSDRPVMKVNGGGRVVSERLDLEGLAGRGLKLIRRRIVTRLRLQ